MAGKVIIFYTTGKRNKTLCYHWIWWCFV